MNIAHEIGTDRCSVYSQDISQKSSNLLRLNLILNNLTHSISNVVEGNTITNPAHTDKRGKFNFIVSNPPFKVDFSEYRDQVADNPAYNERFFAGVPAIPGKKKESMAIYLLFIQHIMWMLADSGKAAIVVPTGFITAQSGIEKTIRERLIENKWLKGVVSMPSNIFATTGTNVSVIFIDKTNQNEKVTLVDASELGDKIKEGKNQRTVLKKEEEKKIIDAFLDTEEIEGFSIKVGYDDIKTKGYSLSAGQYFEIKITVSELTTEQFNERISGLKEDLRTLSTKGSNLEKEINDSLEKIQYA